MIGVFDSVDILYSCVMIIVFTTVGALSIAFFRVQLDPQNRGEYVFVRSCRLVSVVGALFALLSLFYSLMDYRRVDITGAQIITVSTYYLAGCFWSWAMVPLVRTDYLTNHIKLRDMTMSISAVSVTLLLHFGAKIDSKWLVVLYISWFFLHSGHLMGCFVMEYRRSSKKLENYYSDTVVSYLRWLNVSNILIVIYALVGVVVCVFGKMAISLWSLTGMILYCYVYYSFCRYQAHVSQIRVAIVPDKDLPIQPQMDADTKAQSFVSPSPSSVATPERKADAAVELSESLQQIIGDALSRWEARREYCTRGVTIAQLAAYVGTNRTYVSRFLNEVKEVSFYDYIASLRITRAAEIIATAPSAPTDSLYTDLGFSSHAHFVKTFFRLKGVSPEDYRKSLN